MIWSPDGSALAINTGSQAQLLDANNLNAPAISLHNTTWNQPPSNNTPSTLDGGDLAYTDDGNTLIVGHNIWLEFWNLETRQLQGIYVDGDLGTDRFVYDTAQRYLIIGGNNWNHFTVLVEPITGINISQENQGLFFDHEPGLLQSEIQGQWYVSDIALSTNRQYVAIASADTVRSRVTYDPYVYPETPDVFVWRVDRVRFWEAGSEPPAYGTDLEPDLTLVGHTRPVQQIAFSPDGSLLATASLDGTARLWSLPDGAPRAVLRGHLAPVWDVDFSLDGSRLVTASRDGTLRLWDVATGEALYVMNGFGGSLKIAAFSPDGTRIAVAGEDGSIWMLDAVTGTVLDSRPGQQPLWSVAFSPDGQTLATGNDQNEVMLWDVHPQEATASLRQILRGHEGPVYDVAFSPDGTLLASVSADQTIRLWDVNTGETTAVLEGHMGAVYGVAFNDDGTLLASGSYDQTARLWDIVTQETIQVLPSTQPVYSVAFSGDLLAYGDMQLWDIANNRLVAEWEVIHGWSDSFKSPMSKIIFSDDGGIVLNGGYQGGEAWIVDTLEPVSLPTSSVMAIHGNVLAVNSLSLFDLATAQLLTPSSAGGNPRLQTELTRDIAFNPDGTLIVTVGTDGLLCFWGIDPTVGE
jgi:WD40 repeat protein